MAEGMVRKFGGSILQAESAGLRPGPTVAPHGLDVMAEVGIDLAGHRPHSIQAVESPIDMVISLCEVIAPGQDLFPRAVRHHWRIPDPIGGDPDDYRRTRDLIWEKLRPLIGRLTEREDLPERLGE